MSVYMHLGFHGEFTLIEEVLIDENQNETKDIILTFILL